MTAHRVEPDGRCDVGGCRGHVSVPCDDPDCTRVHVHPLSGRRHYLTDAEAAAR